MLFIWLQHLSLTSGHKWQDCIQWHANIRFLPNPTICHIYTYFKKISRHFLIKIFKHKYCFPRCFKHSNFKSPTQVLPIRYTLSPESLKTLHKTEQFQLKTLANTFLSVLHIWNLGYGGWVHCVSPIWTNWHNVFTPLHHAISALITIITISQNCLSMNG